MKIAVKDANVFIDLESMGILDLWFQLGHETITSSYVVMELEEGKHLNALACIRAGQVREEEITPEEMEDRFQTLWSELEESGLSITDVSVLYLAMREDAMVISGDRRLRVEAGVRSVEIHGTLWILDQLVEAGILVASVAADRLEALISLTGSERRFLPLTECGERIRLWRRV